MRKEAKSKRRAKCSYEKCNKEAFLKILGYYRNGFYFCSRGHYDKHMKLEKNNKQNKRK